MSIIGIDLGTTNSVVAIMDGGKPTVIVNQEGERTTPSIVTFKDDKRFVGVAAKRQAITNPEKTIFSIKRFMGMRYDETAKEVNKVPYKVIRGDDGLPRVKIEDEKMSPPQISAIILQKLKRIAEQYLGRPVEKAVITVPAYFNDSQRQATIDAGKIAGLEVERIINEPTAAALAYGLDNREEQTIVVYDFGGGNFDVSVLEVDEGFVQVKSTNGDTHLGGDDVDQVVIDWILNTFKKETGIDISIDKMVMQRLKTAAETAKKQLSYSPSTEINLPFLTADASGPKHLVTTLSRAEFERMIEPIIERTLGPCRSALRDAKISASEVDEVILVGGSTRIPLVQSKVKSMFNKEPNRSVNPDEVVAMGAAIQGGVLGGDESVSDILLVDVTPLSLGLQGWDSCCFDVSIGFLYSYERIQEILSDQQLLSEIQRVTGKDLNDIIHHITLLQDQQWTVERGLPQESAKQLKQKLENLTEKYSLSIYMDEIIFLPDTNGGFANVVCIPRNTTFPTKKVVSISTFRDNQKFVNIQVYQGERKIAKDNHFLGQFKLDGIEMAQRGIPRIEVTFDIDANGVLNVFAKDKNTGKGNNVVIKSSGGLDKDEIDNLIKQAEANAQVDEQIETFFQAKNKLDQEIYQVEKLINENRERFPADAFEELETVMSNARDAQDGENPDKIESASVKLIAVAQIFAQKASSYTSSAPQIKRTFEKVRNLINDYSDVIDTTVFAEIQNTIDDGEVACEIEDVDEIDTYKAKLRSQIENLIDSL